MERISRHLQIFLLCGLAGMIYSCENCKIVKFPQIIMIKFTEFSFRGYIFFQYICALFLQLLVCPEMQANEIQCSL